MNYLYYLGNASLALRVIQYLRSPQAPDIHFMTLIHQLNGWILRVQGMPNWSETQQGNFRAFLGELGIAYQPDHRVQSALQELESGCPIVDVMNRYQVAVIVHGEPDLTEIEAFRQQFIQGLGYCPETLA